MLPNLLWPKRDLCVGWFTMAAGLNQRTGGEQCRRGLCFYQSMRRSRGSLNCGTSAQAIGVLTATASHGRVSIQLVFADGSIGTVHYFANGIELLKSASRFCSGTSHSVDGKSPSVWLERYPVALFAGCRTKGTKRAFMRCRCGARDRPRLSRFPKLRGR